MFNSRYHWNIRISDTRSSQWAMYTGMSAEIAADTIVAGYMVVLVRQKQTLTFTQWVVSSPCASASDIWDSTSKILNSLMLYSIHTGMLTVLVFSRWLMSVSWGFLAEPARWPASSLCVVRPRKCGSFAHQRSTVRNNAWQFRVHGFLYDHCSTWVYF